MITFNKKSWHYRFMVWIRSEWLVPENLCPYVRLLTLYISVGIVFLIFVLFVGLAFASGLLVIVDNIFHFLPKSWTSTTWWYNGFAAAGYLLITFGSIIGFIYFTARALQDAFAWIKRKTYKLANPQIEPNPFIEFVKAKHSKLCPKLKFK